ncbi:MAG TPA: bestrophin family ion channel [Candidatus Nitrosotenuis sp.]|jgi:putative membrane protein|nr:bestrophin family ion channel [Candidatus Nitrosotenuis sp.]
MRNGRPRPLFLFLMAGYHLRSLLGGMLVVGLMAALVCVLALHLKVIQVTIPLAVPGLLGVPVGLLLVFRTNTAYERWWEGRRQLGDLVNTCRFLALKFSAYLPAGDGRRGYLARLLGDFALSLTQHLKGRRTGRATDGLSAPLSLLDELSRLTATLRREDHLDREKLLVVEQGISTLTNILGACERIKSTPMPMAYATHLEIIVLLYVLIVPFGMVTELGWWTVPIVMALFYVMEGIQFIGEEIEDPFGDDPNDLAGEDIARNIAANVDLILNPSLPRTAEELQTV